MPAKDELHGADDRLAFKNEARRAREALVRYVLDTAAADSRGADLHLNQDILQLVRAAVGQEVAAQVQKGLPTREELAALSTAQARATVEDAADAFRRGVFQRLDEALAVLRPALSEAREVDSLRNRKAATDSAIESLTAEMHFVAEQAQLARQDIATLATQLDESFRYLAKQQAAAAGAPGGENAPPLPKPRPPVEPLSAPSAFGAQRASGSGPAAGVDHHPVDGADAGWPPQGRSGPILISRRGAAVAGTVLALVAVVAAYMVGSSGLFRGAKPERQAPVSQPPVPSGPATEVNQDPEAKWRSFVSTRSLTSIGGPCAAPHSACTLDQVAGVHADLSLKLKVLNLILPFAAPKDACPPPPIAAADMSAARAASLASFTMCVAQVRATPIPPGLASGDVTAANASEWIRWALPPAASPNLR